MEAGAELEQRPDAPVGDDRPDVGLKMPDISLSSVVFPEPFRPTRPSASPGATSSDTSRRAHTSLASTRRRAITVSFSVR